MSWFIPELIGCRNTNRGSNTRKVKSTRIKDVLKLKM